LNAARDRSSHAAAINGRVSDMPEAATTLNAMDARSGK